MIEIIAAIALLQAGDRAAGRGQLEAIWSRIESDPVAFHECVLSHYLADAQDEVADELAWDLRALNAALRCTDANAQRYQQSLSIASFMPSLHLNLAEDYFKLGDSARSRSHLESARSFTSTLADNSYGQIIHRGIENLAKKLEADDK
jgi:hypothetical protein